MKQTRTKITLLIACLLFTGTFTAGGVSETHVEAINEQMDNIQDPNHVDSKLGLSEEDILEIDREQVEGDEGHFNIKNIEKEISQLKRRLKVLERNKETSGMSQEEFDIVANHLNHLLQLKNKNDHIHEDLNALVQQLSELNLEYKVAKEKEEGEKQAGGDL